MFIDLKANSKVDVDSENNHCTSLRQLWERKSFEMLELDDLESEYCEAVGHS